MTFAEALDVLGVKLPCNAKDASKAFRRRAMETHPDRGGDPRDFIRVTEALKVAHFGLAEAMVGEGEVEWDRETGNLSWREIARRQMTTRRVEGGIEVGIELTREQSDQLLRNPSAGGVALGQVLQEGARAFAAANRRKALK